MAVPVTKAKFCQPENGALFLLFIGWEDKKDNMKPIVRRVYYCYERMVQWINIVVKYQKK